jgi:hypothetical protein
MLKPVDNEELSDLDPEAENTSPPLLIPFPNESNAVNVKLAEMPTVASDRANPLTVDTDKQTGPGRTKKGE